MIGGTISFTKPNIYQARATLWVDASLPQTLKLTDFKNEKFHFMFPFQKENRIEINNLAISILNSIAFKKEIVEKLKIKTINEEHIKNGNFLFNAEINRKTGSIVLVSEHQDLKFSNNILWTAIEQFESELKKVSQNYSKETLGKASDNNNIFVVHLIEEPNSLEKPIKPKRMQILAISAVTSLFLGVFLAFFMEWWNNQKTKRQG